MLKRQLSYVLLAGFAVVMVVMLMLDDPQTRQNQMLDYNATQQALRPVQLFPEATDPAQIMGIDVLDVTTGKGILVIRNTEGLWYAPVISGTQARLDPTEINQAIVEDAAAAITLLGAEQTYDATPENFRIFGLEPEPSYRFRYRMLDAAGLAYEATVNVGDANPDNVAYYVYVEVASVADQRIYLIPKQLVDFILDIQAETLRIAPTASPVESDVVTSVP